MPDNLSIQQAFEQFSGLLHDFRPLLWSHYAGLVEQGFSDDQALRLTIGFQSSWIAVTFGSTGSEEEKDE